ncbi:MAG: dienelactone hydrolase family protein [Planctomycetes bacterium]|nr:dienelactone hydrolase family protein [Planctomycetota bacterium]
MTPDLRAEIRTSTVEYKHGDAVLEGLFAWDDAIQGRRPGVLVVHEWWGRNDYVKSRAEKLAALGYVAFALDMYGKGLVATDPKEAGALAGKVRGDSALMRERAAAGLEDLRKDERVDATKIAAIGYCFGGTVALELARSGAELAGVVSFHGGLGTKAPAEKGRVKAKVLVLHGADDPHVPVAEVTKFEEEMRAAGVDWQVVSYGGAVHAFTNPGAGNDPLKGAAYHESADQRSWEAMRAFFNEVLK